MDGKLIIEVRADKTQPYREVSAVLAKRIINANTLMATSNRYFERILVGDNFNGQIPPNTYDIHEIPELIATQTPETAPEKRSALDWVLGFLQK